MEEQNKLIKAFVEYFLHDGMKSAVPEFHKSWDLLMPVYEKIERMGHTEIGKSAMYLLLFREMYQALEVLDIQAVHEAIVKFIRWHQAEGG